MAKTAAERYDEAAQRISNEITARGGAMVADELPKAWRVEFIAVIEATVADERARCAAECDRIRVTYSNESARSACNYIKIAIERGNAP